jgi:adenosylhomocysteinase
MTRILSSDDFKVADLTLHSFGRKEIQLAEHEMPGLMAVRKEYADAQPLAGARITRFAAHDHPDRCADRDARRARRGVRWVSCNIFSTQDHAAAAVVVGPNGTPKAPSGTPVFAWKGESLEEYWWCTEQLFDFADGQVPNMILDDGGDATLLVHKGAEFEKAGAVPATAPSDSLNMR